MPYKDKEKQKEYQRNWVKKNKHSQKCVANARKRNIAFVNEIKSKPCMDCGISYPPYVMDFDHREKKKSRKHAVAVLVNDGMSIKRILQEIEKCDLVCANCHRERTYGDTTTWESCNGL